MKYRSENLLSKKKKKLQKIIPLQYNLLNIYIYNFFIHLTMAQIKEKKFAPMKMPMKKAGGISQEEDDKVTKII